MPKTCWYKSTKDKALFQRLFDWLNKLFSMQQDVIIYVRLLHIQKDALKLAVYGRRYNLCISGSLFAPFSDLNAQSGGKSALEAIRNDCSFIRFITVSDLQLIQRLDLNPQIVYRTIVAHRSVHSKLICKSCTSNIEAAANWSHQFSIFHFDDNYLAVIPTANAHLIRAHQFTVCMRYCARSINKLIVLR